METGRSVIKHCSCLGEKWCGLDKGDSIGSYDKCWTWDILKMKTTEFADGLEQGGGKGIIKIIW